VWESWDISLRGSENYSVAWDHTWEMTCSIRHDDHPLIVLCGRQVDPVHLTVSPLKAFCMISNRIISFTHQVLRMTVMSIVRTVMQRSSWLVYDREMSCFCGSRQFNTKTAIWSYSDYFILVHTLLSYLWKIRFTIILSSTLLRFPNILFACGFPNEVLSTCLSCVLHAFPIPSFSI